MRKGSFATCSKQTRKYTHQNGFGEENQTHLIVDQDLHGAVAPLYEDQLVGLTGDGVGEGRAHSGRRVGLEPHAHGERVHLRQTLLHFCIHVVGPHGEGELEFIQRSVFPLTCAERKVSRGRKNRFWKVKPFFHSCHMLEIYGGLIHYTTNLHAHDPDLL